MVRRISEDFDRLTGFAKGYSLSALSKEVGFWPFLKQGHKYYLTVLTTWAEVDHALQAKDVPLLSAKLVASEQPATLLREAVSDYGSALFCCIHGAYKPAHMTLRSSIENFLRAVAGPFDGKALTTTSVYDLFDVAKPTAPFADPDTVPLFGDLHESYKRLCLYTHSASLKHLAQISALDHFPSFEAAGFESWTKEAAPIARAFVSILLLCNPALFHSAHFKAQDVMSEAVSPKILPRLHGKN